MISASNYSVEEVCYKFIFAPQGFPCYNGSKNCMSCIIKYLKFHKKFTNHLINFFLNDPAMILIWMVFTLDQFMND